MRTPASRCTSVRLTCLVQHQPYGAPTGHDDTELGQLRITELSQSTMPTCSECQPAGQTCLLSSSTSPRALRAQQVGFCTLQKRRSLFPALPAGAHEETFVSPNALNRPPGPARPGWLRLQLDGKVEVDGCPPTSPSSSGIRPGAAWEGIYAPNKSNLRGSQRPPRHPRASGKAFGGVSRLPFHIRHSLAQPRLASQTPSR